MTHTNDRDIHIMTYQKGAKQVNFNVPKSKTLSVGDIIQIGSVEKGRQIKINSILESRQSSMRDHNYVRAELVNNF